MDGAVASRPGGRVPAPSRERRRPVRGTSGLHRARCWVTPSRGDPQESATENRPPMAWRHVQARVKRCGKSAPAPGATRAARQTPPGARPDRGRTARPTGAQAPRPPGRPLEPAGNRRPRGMAAPGPYGPGQNPAYRPTRHRTLPAHQRERGNCGPDQQKRSLVHSQRFAAFSAVWHHFAAKLRPTRGQAGQAAAVPYPFRVRRLSRHPAPGTGTHEAAYRHCGRPS